MIEKSIREVATIVGSSTTFVRDMVRDGRLKSVKRSTNKGPAGFEYIVQADSLDALHRLAHANAKKPLGSKWKNRKPTMPRAVVPAPPRDRFKAVLGLGAEKLDLLIQIGERFSV